MTTICTQKRHGLFKKLRYQKMLGLLLAVHFTCIAFAASPLKPDVLTCEYIVNPLGIDMYAPRLSWTLASSARAQSQSAYEIIVSTNENDIRSGRGNVWETKKVATPQSLHITYSGKPLQPFTRYWWRVRVWDKAGNTSDWSNPAHFETGVLQSTDWKGQWINDGSKQFERDEDFYKDDPMPLLRKEFNTGKKIASARLYICGLGYYEAYINGTKVGDQWLAPGFTTFKKEAHYVTHDVTSHLRNGKNAIGIMLGNGWYNPLPLRLFSRFNLRDHQQTGRPVVKAQMLVRYTDGSTEWIATDESWKASSGPVVRNNVYLGEHYDARLEKEGWATTNANSNGWKSAVKANGPSGEITAQMIPPVRVTKIINPVSIKQVGKDTFIVDMGQNFAGVARIQVQGPAGKRVMLRYGEDIHPDGRLNFLTTTAGHIKEMWNLKGGPGAPKTAWQEDSYILKGGGKEVWAPRFTFHGFRYVEITGWPGTPTVNDIAGLRMNSDVATDGTFASSNDMFNKLNDVIKWTFLSNIFSVQSDCPGREKMGYGADIVVTSEAYLYNYDMANFYRKTVQDFANEQQPDGGITEIAPYTGIADRGYGGESGPLGWQLAFPYLQKQLYDFYGDKKIISQNWSNLVKQMDFLQSKAVGNLFYWDISDHEALDTKPEALTAASFYYHHAVLAAEFAGILNKKEDSLKYAELSKRIKGAILQKYDVKGTGRFDNGTQAAQIFALWYDFAPDMQQALKVLMDEYARHNWHLSTGIFSTKMMFDVARQMNQNEALYKVANQRDYPGWGHMLNSDATTLWESWKKPDNATTLNHPMFGSISEWFYRSLLGINAAAPGFEKILIKPQPAGDLKWAKGSYKSVRGVIASDWKRDRNDFSLTVTIPANTTAEVWIPAKEGSTVKEGGKKIGADGVQLLRYQDGYAVLATPSGTYNFTSDL